MSMYELSDSRCTRANDRGQIDVVERDISVPIFDQGTATSCKTGVLRRSFASMIDASINLPDKFVCNHTASVVRPAEEREEVRKYTAQVNRSLLLGGQPLFLSTLRRGFFGTSFLPSLTRTHLETRGRACRKAELAVACILPSV